MDQFTISELQKYSGVNVHSIRAWEKRYNALTPHRTQGNTRYYDGDQLRRLLNIVSLMNDEYKVSELCSMSDLKLSRLLQIKLEGEKTQSENDEFLVSQMVASAMRFDESLFDKIFLRAVAKYNLEGAYLKVIYPAVQRLGVLWTIDGISPAQEHFATHLVKQKLISSVDILPINHHSKKNWLLFLPEGEFHEIGLLMANYLIRNAGQRTTYLGANVPFGTIKDAVGSIKPSFLLFFLVAGNNEEEDQKFVASLITAFPQQKIVLSAEADRLKQIRKHKNLFFASSMNDLVEQLK
jgi:DNA-binding transcriptional MerR regulator